MKKEIVIAVVLSLIVGLIIGLVIPSSKNNYDDLFPEFQKYAGKQFKEVNYDWILGSLSSNSMNDGIGAIQSFCKEKLTDEVIGVDLTNTDCIVDFIQKTGDFTCEVYEGQTYDCFVPLNVQCTCWYPE